MRYRILPAAIGIVSLPWTVPAAAQEVASAAEAKVFEPVSARNLKWSPVALPGFPEGVELAVVNGDPSAAAPYVFRLRMPDGYKFPAHWHPTVENLTMLEGDLRLAMGETVDDSKLQTYRPGDFMRIEARHPHFGDVRGTTVVQLHGTGPFKVVTVGMEADTTSK